MIKLNEKYNLETFTAFLTDFLPNDYREEEKDLSQEAEKCKKIIKAKELGYSKSLDVYVLEMTHTSNSDPRVTITAEAFKLLATYGIDKALVVFKSENSDNWRLSYMTITLDIDEKSKITKSFSNPRRYSFFLGPNARIKTPERQLLVKERVKDKDDLMSRFSIEVVNKEFYKEIQKFFDLLVKDEHLKLPSTPKGSVEIKDFAVRLIGRVMFCWFLKQKGGDKGTLIPDEILSSDAVGKNSNYYHVTLEPLFFELLNTPQDDRNVAFRNKLYDLVPYLNGGLFNPQTGDFYDFDTTSYSSRYINTLVIKDEWFIDFFKLLETYNFTIDENTVIDQELSVDPEMLGIIFENLLGEIDADTGESSRKKTGSFYTPRPIVEYMVDKSLVQYLIDKTGIEEKKVEALVSYNLDDDKAFIYSSEENTKVVQAVNGLRVIDPACGSGAFPIGMLQKVLHVLRCADPECEIWFEEKLKNVPEIIRGKIKENYQAKSLDYTRKLSIIKDSIFGVDIQHIAVEVSRLRCFLTLIVESEIDDTKPNRNIDPLPNLDFKFVCANTLIPAPEANVGMFGDANDVFQREFEQEVEKYFNSSGQKKSDAMNKIHRLIDQKIKEKISSITNFSTSLQGEKFKEVMVRKNSKKIGSQINEMALWESYKNIFENKPVDFFDIKYFFPNVKDGFDIVIANPPYDVYQGHRKDEIEQLNNIPIYKLAKGGKLNAYKLFLAKSTTFTKNNGIICEIFQNSFLGDSSAKNIRKHFIFNQNILLIDSFPERDDINKRVFEGVKMSVCIMLSKNTINDDYAFKLNVWEDKHMRAGRSMVFKKSDLAKFDIENVAIPMLVEEDISILKKISSCSKLSNYARCYEGEVNLTFHKKYLRNEVEGNHPMIKGAAVQKWHIRDEMSQGEIEYLDPLFLVENNSPKSRHYLQKRLVLQGITGVDERSRIKAAILDSGIFCGNSVNYIILDSNATSNEYLLAILNSKLINWYFKIFSTNSNVNGYEVNNLPIVISDNNIKNKIEELVNKILSISTDKDYWKDDNKKKLVRDVESEINMLVYFLYGLTEDEIKIVEENGK